MRKPSSDYNAFTAISLVSRNLLQNDLYYYIDVSI
jgi:hypothetical protein